ncbi:MULTISPECIES: recombinase family protein [Paenibacillus]|uniref:recombinase family protein n=1 Tax=Paenibacillus alvei TaxID=44250 RepID=UPI0009DB6DD0
MSRAKKCTLPRLPTPSQVIGKSNASLYWQGTSVKKILQNPHYVGDLVQGREATLNVTNKKKGVFKRRGLGCCPKYP